jgi:glycosyltransferase involved in cell wall biosynthesis
MKLDILICTYGKGVWRVPSVLLPVRQDVRYVVSYQYDDEFQQSDIPCSLFERNDVEIYPIRGKGLAVNRNHALSQMKGDIALFADDDVRYTNRQIDCIFDIFSAHKELDIACFRAEGLDGSFLHHYAHEPFSYEQRPYGTFFSSCEIVVRNCTDLPRFDVRFGLESPFLACGEEEVFLHESYLKGLVIRFFPITIVRTPSATTGRRFACDKAVQRSKGAVLYVLHGFWGAMMRVVKYACCHVTEHRSSVLVQMVRGIWYMVCSTPQRK